MKLFLGICNGQYHVPSDFFWSFIHMRNPYPVTAYRSGHPWDVVRNNRIIANFLKSDCDVLIKMDIDQEYPPNFLEKLVPLVEKYKVIGPLIYDRHKVNGYMPLLFEEYNGLLLKKMDISEMSGIVKVPFPHTNLFYHREVIEKIDPPWYEAYLSYNGLVRQNHVDYTFIDKIHKAGYDITIDLDCVVGHQYIGYVGSDFSGH